MGGWLPVVAAARISEQTGDEAELLRLAEEGFAGRRPLPTARI